MRHREKETERLAKEVATLTERLNSKEHTISNLSKELSTVLLEGPKEDAKLESKISELDRKSEKMSADMEMMEENLKLQAVVAEKDELINSLTEQLISQAKNK
jgi:hypothetical protein